MNCREVEDTLIADVDGAILAPEVAAHLESCAACRDARHAQAVVRTLLQARGAQLAPITPPALRARIVEHLATAAARDLRTSGPPTFAKATAGKQDLSAPLLGWSGRLSAFAAAAMLILTLGAVLLPVATVRSTALLAAQLALDHLKCFTIDGDADGAVMSKADAEATLKREFDLAVAVPDSVPSERLELLAVRRCLYGDGLAAHLLYRLGGEPVSLFVVPGLTRPAAELSLFGQDEVVWTEGDRTYMLVARAGLGSDLSRVASYLRTEAK